MYHKYSLLKSIAFILFSLLFVRSLNAQCTSSLPHSPLSAASVSFTGSKFGYDIPNNALTADNVYATATAILAVLSGPTQNLTLTNFGFAVPSSATICGVVAVVKKKAANINTLSTVSDNSVKLVKGGVVSGTNKALAGNWTTTNTAFTYGGDADSWGLTLTPADINASNFGIAFSANIVGTISLIPSAQIDNIQLTVYYTINTLPVLLSDFKANVSDNKVILQWKSENEIDFNRYEIERSREGHIFQQLGAIEGSNTSNNYSYTDEFPDYVNYYRLKVVDMDGTFDYSPIVPARLPRSASDIKLANVPGQCVILFKNCNPGKYRLEIVTTIGQVLYSREVKVKDDLTVSIPLPGLAKGVYLVNIYSDINKFSKSIKWMR